MSEKKNLKKLLKHLVYMVCLSVGILYIFFYVALPHITHQSKIVQVPDLAGVHFKVLDEALSKHRLRYVITDNSGYSAQLPPFTVLQQFPAAGALVKENRKIYLTLNAENPPKVSMPNLIERSVREAQLQLKNRGLQLGHIKYQPDITEHAVLEQWHNGHPMPAGKLIHKGSTIDLVVSAGLGKQVVEVPDVTNMPLEEAKLLLINRGIGMGMLHPAKDKKNRDKAIGTITGQHPAAGTKLPIGSTISLWMVKKKM